MWSKLGDPFGRGSFACCQKDPPLRGNILLPAPDEFFCLTPLSDRQIAEARSRPPSYPDQLLLGEDQLGHFLTFLIPDVKVHGKMIP
jgi:hypothetical protein